MENKCKNGHVQPKRNHFGRCAECNVISNNKWKLAHPERLKLVQSKARPLERRYYAALKLEILSHYGPLGMLGCCWPGCSVIDIDVLSLDHVNDDGAAHRRRLGRGKKNNGTARAIYRELKKAGFPEGYQTLCFNHQWKKRICGFPKLALVVGG